MTPADFEKAVMFQVVRETHAKAIRAWD